MCAANYRSKDFSDEAHNLVHEYESKLGKCSFDDARSQSELGHHNNKVYMWCDEYRQYILSCRLIPYEPGGYLIFHLHRSSFN